MKEVTDWLLRGDVSIQYMTHLLLLQSQQDTLARLQERIMTEGWGAEILSRQNPGGHWDIWFYQRKWICTHYTLTDLMQLGVPPSCAPCRGMVIRAYNECMLDSGGINFAKTRVQSDICVDGMCLSYAAYFCPEDARTRRLAAYILAYQNSDGGFGWDTETRTSDPDTTICVLEGLHSCEKAGITTTELKAAKKCAAEYLLENLLFTGGDPRFQKLTFPYRYKYSLLRALEYFAGAELSPDVRLEPALDWLCCKHREKLHWTLESRYKGREHILMEEIGKPSRFVTVKALFILRRFRPGFFDDQVG